MEFTSRLFLFQLKKTLSFNFLLIFIIFDFFVFCFVFCGCVFLLVSWGVVSFVFPCFYFGLIFQYFFRFLRKIKQTNEENYKIITFKSSKKSKNL